MDELDVSTCSGSQISIFPPIARVSILVDILDQCTAGKDFVKLNVLIELAKQVKKTSIEDLYCLRPSRGTALALSEALTHAVAHNWFNEEAKVPSLHIVVIALQAGCFAGWNPHSILKCFSRLTLHSVKELVAVYRGVLQHHYALDFKTALKVMANFELLLTSEVIKTLAEIPTYCLRQ